MSHIVTFPSTAIRDREWWAHEVRRVGTDWETLGRAAARVFCRLQFTSSLCWGDS